MADVNKSVAINYTASTKDLEKELKKIPDITDQQAKQAVSKLDSNFQKMESSAESTSKKIAGKMKDIGKSFVAVAGTVTAMGAGIVALQQQFADLTNEMVDASTKSGIAVETLAGLRLAAEGSGLQFANLESGLIRFQGSIVNASRGSKILQENFERLGVSVTDTNGEVRSSNDVFNDTIKALSTMTNQTEKNTVAMELFGRAGGAGLMQSGALDNLEAMTELATQFGINLTSDGVNAMGMFQRKMAEFETVSVGAMQNLLGSIAGPNGVNMGIEGASKAIVFLGAVTEDIVGLIGQSFENIFALVEAGSLAMSGDFGRAGALMNDIMNENEQAVLNVANTFSRASERMEQFSKLSAKSTAPATMKAVATETERASNEMDDLSESTVNVEKAIQAMSNELDKTVSKTGDLISMVENRGLSSYEQEKNKILETGVALQQQFDIYSGLLDSVYERILAGEDSIELENQMKQILEDQIKIGDTIAINKKLEEKELSDLRQKYHDEEVDRRTKQAEHEQQLNDQIKSDLMEKIDTYVMYGEHVFSTVSSIGQAFSDVAQKQIDELTMKADSDLEQIDNMVQNGVISQENGAKRKEQIEKDLAEKTAKYRERMFKVTQATAVADVIFQGAIATTKALAEYGFPAGLAIGGLILGQVGAQLASIKAQTPPKFDVGGMVGNMTDNAPDMVRANLLEGEAVLDRATVRRIGGEQGVRDLQRGTAGDRVIVVQPFKHWDRFVKSGGLNSQRDRKTVSGIGKY